MRFKVDKLHRTAGTGISGAEEAAPVMLFYPPLNVSGDSCIEGIIGASHNVNCPVVHRFLRMDGVLGALIETILKESYIGRIDALAAFMKLLGKMPIRMVAAAQK